MFGPVAQLGERTVRIRKVEGSIPFGSTKKEVTFVYQKLLLFLSKPQAWHIITARSVVHIISPFGAVSHHAPACILLRLDEMQHFVLMICNSFGIDDIQCFALIYFWKSSIILLKGVVICKKTICLYIQSKLQPKQNCFAKT